MKPLFKRIALILALVLGCLPLASCVGNEPDPDDDDSDNTKIEESRDTEADETDPDTAESEPAESLTPDTSESTPTDTAGETEPGTEPGTDPEIELVGVEGFAYLFDTKASITTTQLSRRRSLAAHIRVSENCYLDTFTLGCTTMDAQNGSFDVSFFRWDTDYSTTVAGEPLHKVTITPDGHTATNGSITIDLPAKTFGEGEWLYLIQNNVDAAFAVGTGTSSPESCKSEDVVPVEFYSSGRVDDMAAQGYVTYTRYEKATEDETPIDPSGYTKLTEGKAHVIILTGQSNSAGQSLVSYLSSKIDAQTYARYEAGYENILIDVHPDNNIETAVNTGGFVPVKLGQGSYSDRFGIEIGLADYLTRTYPGETFYIIKSGFSASGLAKHWQKGGICYTPFAANLQTSLGRLRSMGLDPEVFAIMWMQGETDACSTGDTGRYGRLLVELIDRLTEDCGTHVAPGGPAFIDAAICESSIWPYAKIVNQFKEVGAATSQNRYFIDTNTDPKLAGLYENNDPAHYDSVDMIKLGELFGKVIGTVIENSQKT